MVNQRPPKLDTNVSGRTEGGLVGTRYGMPNMSQTMDEKRSQTMYVLEIEGEVPYVISKHYPDIIPTKHAEKIREATYRGRQNIDDFLARVIAKEAVNHHLEDSIYECIREDAGEESRSYVHPFMTSADSSENAKALMTRDGLRILITDVEGLRDGCLSIAVNWLDKGYLHMSSTHGADALPRYLGRRLVTEAYMLQAEAERFAYDLKNHVVGKLSGAVGDYHSMTAAGIDGPLIERECCNAWGIRPVVSEQDAPREHLAFVLSDVAVSGRTVANIVRWVKYLKNTARGELREEPDPGQTGSSAMPHKDGNPFVEERVIGFSYRLQANFDQILQTTAREDSRNLEGSALDRLVIPDTFVLFDYGVALAENVLLRIEPQPDNLKAGLERTYGAPTSERIRYKLINRGMPERPARTLSGSLARQAMLSKRPYVEMLLESPEVSQYLSEAETREFSDPEKYTGQSAEIIRKAHDELFGKSVLS